LPWGVDLSFYPDLSREAPTEFSYVFAAGKTQRDFQTLVDACRCVARPLLISCDQSSAPAIDATMNNVRIRTALAASTAELVDDYRGAMVVAIPLTPRGCERTMNGVTSLLEAMALGKPVIMTRNRTIGIDIEQAEIGIWVDPGDVRGWERAVQFVFSHPLDARRMGQNGRRLCEERYGMERFSADLAGYFQEVARV
jgi:glycosyltransferase involved in cell wall biosynthesis